MEASCPTCPFLWFTAMAMNWRVSNSWKHQLIHFLEIWWAGSHEYLICVQRKGYVGLVWLLLQVVHCLSNKISKRKTFLFDQNFLKTFLILVKSYRLQTLCILEVFNHVVKIPDVSDLALHADHGATRCYCLIDSSTGNTQKLSVSADKEVACLLWKKHPFNNGWNQARSFDPADHFTLLTLPLCWLTAHNVQYIKLRQQTNSSWGQSPSEARPAVTAAPAVWTELWSLSGFPLLDPDILNMEHILLQRQHNEIWVKAASVYSHKNAKNVSVVLRSVQL